MVWIGVGMASGNAAKGQQKTHTSLERVGFMFKVHRFGTLYFADVHEVSRPRNPLISLAFIGGASRIRTADLWIMMKKFIKNLYKSWVFFWCVARCVVRNLLLLAFIDACTGDGLVTAILTPKLQRNAQGSIRKRQKFDDTNQARTS